MAKSSKIRLVPMLLSISKSLRALMGFKLAEIGIRPGQDELLLALSADRTVSMSHIADKIGVRPSTATKMANHLVAAGLVERSKTSKDARHTLLRITPSGTEMQGRVRKVWQSVENELQELPDINRAEKDLERLQEILATRLRPWR